jgi:hypothetical protein
VNIVERIEATGKAIVQYRKLREDVHLGGRIRERLQRLDRICVGLEPLSIAQRELTSAGRSMPVGVAGALMKLRTQLSAQRDLVKDDVSYVAGDAFVDTLQEVERRIDALQLSSETEWARFAAEDVDLPEISIELLRSLQGLDQSFASECERIRELQASVELIKSRSLPGNGDVVRLRGAAEDLRKAWANLGAGSLTDKIRAFLVETASPDGATVARLAPEVLTWLRKHSLESRFRVRQSTR